MTLKDLTPQEALQQQQAGALLVDVRENDEYAEVHAVGAQLLPLSELASRYQELPQDRPLLMICKSGKRSQQAAEYLLERGYTQISNVSGGTSGWVAAGLPSEGQG